MFVVTCGIVSMYLCHCEVISHIKVMLGGPEVAEKLYCHRPLVLKKIQVVNFLAVGQLKLHVVLLIDRVV